VPSQRCPISIICVFNDAPVREQCLDRSIERHRSEVDDLDYVLVDNRDGTFRSAGAAFNFGATQARHDHLVFVHQDVVLHSLSALEHAAAVMHTDRSIGLLGAIGAEPGGRLVGRVRDRVVLIGERTDRPVDVDAIDEVLFIVPRRVLDRERLSDEPEFAWHAYAVEYGLRLRQDGLRVCAVDVPLTHNSMALDAEQLDAAYVALARAYPDALPVRTPTRLVTRWERAARRGGLIGRHGWRWRWLRESVAAHVGRRAVGGARCVLGDIRWGIDDLLAGGASPLLIVNFDRDGTFVDDRPDPLVLNRLGHELHVTSGGPDRAVDAIRTAHAGSSVLVSGLRAGDLRKIAPHLTSRRPLLGFRGEIGYWLLLGPNVDRLAAQLRSERFTPIGMRWESA
jgi:Glycosyltransferase like family